MRVGLAGNPNSGKTSLFNALTGAQGHVGNYAGVTIEALEGPLRADLLQPAPTLAVGAAAVAVSPPPAVALVDLPGCYSLTARSAEEEVALRGLLGEVGSPRCDRVICTLDVTQLARGLYLLLQLRELGLPCVVALTMDDLAAQRGLQVDAAELADALGVPVVVCSARTGAGLAELARRATAPLPSPAEAAAAADTSLLDTLNEPQRRALQGVVAALADDPRRLQVPHAAGLALWLATARPDAPGPTLGGPLQAALAGARAALSPAGDGAFARTIIGARFRAVDALVRRVQAGPARHDARTQAIDEVLLHPVWGVLVLIFTLFVLFQGVFAWAQPMMQLAQDGVGWAASVLGRWVPPSATQSLLVHGVLAGLGNVVAFVPQIALLFLGLGVLEESGYMARAALVLDRVMRRVGLHGRAFIPLMSSFACAVPGIMAARTLDSRRDRLVTMLIAPFMGCSARLPVYTLVVAATFADVPPLLGVLSVGGLVIFAMYALGFVAALGTAALLRRTALPPGQPTLVLELPAYRVPRPQAIGRQVARRCAAFVRGTGGTILMLSVLLWAGLNFPRTPIPEAPAFAAWAEARGTPAASPEALTRAWQLEHSLGGQLGHAIEPAIRPLGFDWRIGVGLLASFAAREVLVSTLAQVYALDAEAELGPEPGDGADGDGPRSPALRDALRADVDPATGKPRFTPLTGVSLMVFFVLAMQCLSTIATLRRETGGWRWPLWALAYMNALAYLASLAVYQGGRLLGLG